MSDLRFAFRQLLKNPGFTAVAVLTLALGIGATTAIFSVVYAVVLRPLPFPESERLVAMWTQTPQVDRLPMAAANHRDLQAQTTVFEDVALLSRVQNHNLTGDGEPERLLAVSVAANLFPLLRAQPTLGRGFTEDENQPGQDRVAILSHGLWQRRYAGDPSIVGKTIRLENVPHTVVGVMPHGFWYPTHDVQIWTPLTINPDQFRTRAGFGWLTVARLKPGVTLEQAQTEANVVAARLAAQYPDRNKDVRFMVTLFAGSSLLLAMVGIYGVLAWTVRQRTREMGVRLALGAQKRNILTLVIVQGMKLALIGVGIGLAAALGLTRLMRTLLYEVNPSDPLTFAGVSLLLLGVAFLACWLPARRAARVDPMVTLRSE